MVAVGDLHCHTGSQVSKKPHQSEEQVSEAVTYFEGTEVNIYGLLWSRFPVNNERMLIPVILRLVFPPTVWKRRFKHSGNDLFYMRGRRRSDHRKKWDLFERSCVLFLKSSIKLKPNETKKKNPKNIKLKIWFSEASSQGVSHIAMQCMTHWLCPVTWS